ncbi:unnamed protein product [Lactuca saligna]|uniref:Uncharacterized protein n=1 Tax=Lactuca saligna TaxID=75948 RepID=A0AA35Z5D7_LACSI|nr:unnamed protein product [Lactuca saligna]
MNSLLQLQADIGSRYTVSGIEFDVLLKSQEHRLIKIMEKIETKHEEHLKHHADSFQYEGKELRVVAKEIHILFLEEVKKVKDDVNIKVEVIQIVMSKEIVKLSQNYSDLHTKVDVIVGAVMKEREYFTSFSTWVDTKHDSDSNMFAKMEELLGSVKESFSKLNVSLSSSVSQESLSKMFSFL